MDNIERLFNIAETASKYGDRQSADWFRDGLECFLSGEKSKSLDDALGLSPSGPGQISARRKYSKSTRDKYLRQAFDLIDTRLKKTKRCDLLASEIRAFESRIWGHWMELDEPPKSCSEVRRLIFLAKKTGEILPTNFRTVWRIIFDF